MERSLAHRTEAGPQTGERAGARKPALKGVALPAEHGSWSLVLEPILLALLVAPSWSGLAWAAAAFALFLAYQPVSVAWSDWRRGRKFARTETARRFATVYLLVAGAAGVLGWWQSGAAVLLPGLLALPLLLTFVYYDQQPGRSWQAELAAPAAFAAIAAVIALAAGWAVGPAFALWGVVVARAVPAVLFVRVRLRLDKGKLAAVWPPLLAHIMALGAIAVLVGMGLTVWTAVVASLLMLLRAVWALSPWRWRTSVKTFGFFETGMGLLYVLVVAAGYWWS